MAAVAAFGAIGLSAVYATHARRRGAVEEVLRYFAKPPGAEGAVLVVAPFGVAAVLVNPGGQGLGQLWTTAALALWVVASTLWVTQVRPAELALRGGVPLAQAAGQRLARAGAATSLIFVLALGLMLFQPG